MYMNKPPNNRGIKRLINAYKFSIQGLKSTFETEEAFRMEFYIALFAVPASFFVAQTLVEWLILIISLSLVIMTELINSAIEAVVDRFGREKHYLSGKAKDAGSAAVFIAMMIVLIVWIPMVYMRILPWLPW